MNRDFIDKINNAKLFIRQGKYPNAIEMLNQAIQIYPLDPYPYNRKGYIYLLQTEYYKSIECYEKAIDMGMRTPDIYSNIALAEYYIGRYEEALRDAEYAIKLYPSDVSACNTKGLVLSKIGDDKLAIEAFTIAINYGYKDAKIYRNRGKSYLHVGLLKEALDDLNTSIELDPNYHKLYNTRGLVFAAANKHDLAILDFKKAIEINPEFELSYFNLADSYFRIGDYEFAYNNIVAGEELCKDDFVIQKYGLMLFTVLSHFSSPFLLYRLINRIYIIDTFLSFQQMINENFEQCLNLLILLDYLDKNESLRMEHYHLYKGIINYYMKDPSICYKIFDEIVDVDDSENLMGQYYYMLSCNNYQFSEKGLVYKYALEKARNYANNSSFENNTVQMYYTGQILLITEHYLEALHCFEKCEEFIPAFCMRIVCFNQLNELDKRDELISELLMFERYNKGLLQYLEFPSIGLSNFENSIHMFSYIKEIEGIIPILNQYSEVQKEKLKLDYGSIIGKIAEGFTFNEDRIEGRLSLSETVLWKNKLLERVYQETEEFFLEHIKDHFIAWQSINNPNDLELSIGREIPLILNIINEHEKIIHLVDYFDIKGGLNCEARYLLWFWSEICKYKSRKLTELEKRTLKISISGLFKIAIGSFVIPYFLPAVVFFIGYQITKDNFTKMIMDFIEQSFVKEGKQIPNFYSEFKKQFEIFMSKQLRNSQE